MEDPNAHDPIIEALAKGSFEEARALDYGLEGIEWGDQEMHARVYQQEHRQYATRALASLLDAGYEVRKI